MNGWLRSRLDALLRDPNHWTDEERALIDAGKCCWTTFDPYHPHCRARSESGMPYCGDHIAELADKVRDRSITL